MQTVDDVIELLFSFRQRYGNVAVANQVRVTVDAIDDTPICCIYLQENQDED